MILTPAFLQRPVFFLIILNAVALLSLTLAAFWPFRVPLYNVDQDIAGLPSTPAVFLGGSFQKSALVNLLERPVFHSGRKAIFAPSAKIEAVPVVADNATGLEDIRLIGIVQSGPDKGWIYLYSSRDNKQILLKKGEGFNGWRLTEISSDKITLTRNNEIAVMEQKNGGNPQYGTL